MSNQPRLPIYVRMASSRSLRTITLISTLFSALWTLASGANLIRSRDKYQSPALGSLFLAFGSLYLAVSALEFAGFAACFTQRMKLVKIFVMTTVASAGIVIITELSRTIAHFAAKTAIQAACTLEQMAENNGSSSDFTTAQAQSYCAAGWQNACYFRIGFFILTTILALIFSSLAASYLYQLNHPETLRQTNVVNQQPPSSTYNYPLAPYPSHNQPVYDSAPPYQAPPPGFASEENKGMMSSTEEKELAQHLQQQSERAYNNNNGFGESTETVTLEPRDGRRGEGRV